MYFKSLSLVLIPQWVINHTKHIIKTLITEVETEIVMRSIPFNYILFFPFQIKNCKGKTYRLKLSVFDAFRRGYFFVCVSYLLFKSNFMHFVEDSYTVKKSSFNSFPLPFFLKNDSLAKAGSMVTVTIWVCCKGGDGPVLTATCWVLCPPL